MEQGNHKGHMIEPGYGKLEVQSAEPDDKTERQTADRFRQTDRQTEDLDRQTEKLQ